MNANDEKGKLPTGERPFRILIICGSDRRQYNRPCVDAKSRTLMLRMAEHLPQQSSSAWALRPQALPPAR